MRKLLAIFAHPDDEVAFAGTLAHYARHETEVRLICATRGEAGEISDPTLATPETLAEVRTAELQRACEIIGIHELHFLGYRDSGMAGAPANEDRRALVQAAPAEVTERLAAFMRRLKPDVVITFEPFGWYGHPDHQAVSRYATAAYRSAADATLYPSAGQLWQPQRLFHAVLPASNFQIMMDYARANNIDVSEFEQRFPLDRLKETEAQITHILDIDHLVELKQTAWLAHRTQHSEDNWFQKMPEELIRRLWGYEHFIQVSPAAAGYLNQDRAVDLFGDK